MAWKIGVLQFGQTASLPISLTNPAPPGGLVVSVASDDPSRVEVQTATVTIAAGATTGNAVFVVVQYTGPNCDSGAITPSPVATKVTATDVWLSESRSQRLHPDATSAFMIIGSISSVPGTFDLLIDDVFLKKR